MWVLMLAGWTAAVAAFSGHLTERTVARVVGVLGIVAVGFLLFLLATSDPFRHLVPAPIEGRDLNPILQDWGMVVHRRCCTWATSGSPSRSRSRSPRCSAIR